MMKGVTSTMIVVLLAMISLSHARMCYNCTGDCVTDSDCDGSCVSKSHTLGDEPEVRYCIEDSVLERCIPSYENGQEYKVCFCNTERCNGSTSLSASLSVLLTSLLLGFSN